MNAPTARPLTHPALARMPVRRRARLSAADRFWMVLGSIAGLMFVPAAGIALLPEDDGTPPGRSSSAPDPSDTGPRGSAETALALADADSTPTPASSAASVTAARAAAQTGAAAQQARLTPITADDDTRVAADPAAIRALLASAGGGSSSAADRFAAGDSDDFDPTLVLRPSRAVGLDHALPVLPLGLVAGLPDGWPSLADVLRAGADADTFGAAATFLIVSRAQDHMIETGDGVLHMLVNRGLDLGLTLISSHDDGATWTVDDSLAGDFGPANRTATSDIRLLDGQDVMIVSYLDGSGAVGFAMYGYDPQAGGWTLLQGTTVDAGLVSPQTVQATIAFSSEGSLLLAYTEETPDGLRLVLQQSLDGGRTWTGAVLDQPDIDAGAARAISVGDHDGVIYSNAEAMYWVTWDESHGWDMEVIDAAGTIGRFASHFSTVTEGVDVIVANVGTDLTLRILHFDGETGTWSDPIAPLRPGIEISSAQISISDDTGRIYVTYDDPDNPGRLVIIESRDGGETWRLEAVLQTPEGIVAPPTRFEAPEHFSGDLVVTQQVLAPGDQTASGLYYHVVDVDGPGTPIPPDVILNYVDDFVF